MTRIYADGSISHGTHSSVARIVGTSPRVLTIPGEVDTDVTHVWHMPALNDIVDAIIEHRALPAGFHLRQRRDGCQMIGIDRA